MQIEGRRSWLALALLGLVLLAAVALRLPGFDGRALWVDELWRVNLILDDNALARYWQAPDVYTAITAPLYLLLNWALGYASMSPSILRLSSLLPGLVSVALAFAIARRAGAGLLLSCCAALLVATNTEFIHYSNEFKPYMFEVMVHLVCLYLWLDLITSESTKRQQWIFFFSALAVAALSAANIVFLLPAMGLTLLDKVWVRERACLKSVLGGFAAVGVLVILLYLFVWSYGSDKGLTNYWADGFHNATRESYLVFAGKRLLGLWRGAFSAIGTRHAMVYLSVAGLACVLFTFLRGRAYVGVLARSVSIFYAALLVTLLAVNKVGLWPVGAFRPNQFLFAHLALSWILFLAIFLSVRGRQWIGGVAIGVLVVGGLRIQSGQLAGIGPPVEQSDRVWESFAASAPVGKLVTDQCKTHPVTVFLNPGMSHASQYYALYPVHMKQVAVFSTSCVRLTSVPDAYANPQAFRERMIDLQPGQGMYWHAYSHLNNDEVNKLKALAREFGALTHEESFEGAGYFAVVLAGNSQND